MTEREDRRSSLKLSDVDMSPVLGRHTCKVGLHGTHSELPDFYAIFMVRLPKGSPEEMTLESLQQAAEAQVMKFARGLLDER